MKYPLTKKQLHVLYVVTDMMAGGAKMNYFDISERCGFNSIQALQRHLKALKHKGYLFWPRYRFEEIRLMPKNAEECPTCKGIGIINIC